MRLQDTPPGDTLATLPRYLEVKVKPGGAVFEYETGLVHRDRKLVIVRFLMPQGGGPPDFRRSAGRVGVVWLLLGAPAVQRLPLAPRRWLALAHASTP